MSEETTKSTKETKKTKKVKTRVSLDFWEYPEILDMLESSARTNVRTIPQEIIFRLLTSVCEEV